MALISSSVFFAMSLRFFLRPRGVLAGSSRSPLGGGC
jgi:hypothetical protein